MKLVVLGAPGTMVTVRYKADGVPQEETVLVPATIPFKARNVEWEVIRPSGDEEFRVELLVGDLKRLSTTSGRKSKIRGAMVYNAQQEKYWAQPVD